MTGAEKLILVAVALNAIVLGLIWLSEWQMKHQWRRISRHLYNREAERLLRDFVVAFDYGNQPEAMAAVYDRAVVLVDRLTSFRAAGLKED